MALRKTSIHNRGFTLIEILIVIGLFSVIAMFAAFVDIGSIFGNSFRGEERTIVSMLQSARMDAMDNTGQTPHGLAIFPADNPHAYVLFSGASYASDPSSHYAVASSYDIGVAGAPQGGVVFAQLSGESGFAGEITLTDPKRGIQRKITINNEGAIDW